MVTHLVLFIFIIFRHLEYIGGLLLLCRKQEVGSHSLEFSYKVSFKLFALPSVILEVVVEPNLAMNWLGSVSRVAYMFSNILSIESAR